jgi:hypothetical protein
MADDDNFDIDIYGEDESTTQQDATLTDPPANTETNAATSNGAENTKTENGDQTEAGSEAVYQRYQTNQTVKREQSHEATNGAVQHDQSVQQIASTGGAAGQDVLRQAPQQQGTKRKQGEDDDRPTDPGATAALMINDINWWISEEDIRGWANQSGCEDELTEVTFNEHKVNGKSKG